MSSNFHSDGRVGLECARMFAKMMAELELAKLDEQAATVEGKIIEACSQKDIK